MLHETYETESQKPYFTSIQELLEKYEDGWNIFIKAHELQDYDIPIPRKSEYKDDPYLPSTWLALADRVISIIAHEKYHLKTNPNRIEIVRADQMLDAYVKPVPNGPPHWSHGKKRIIEQQKFDKNKHLAYEIIINSNPALAYCMDSNSPVMQMLVIAHASYGHNAFYKNNYLFDDLTDADSIMHVNERLRQLVEECEEKYGIDEVESVLDMCNSMSFMNTSPRLPKGPLSKKQKEKRKQEQSKRFWKQKQPTTIFNSAKETLEAEEKETNSFYHPHSGRRNILRFIADEVEHLPEWKREIMRLSSKIAQNFSANIRTNMINEGIACITHFQIMEDLFTIGLMNAQMHGEFRTSHAGVTYQPPGYIIAQNPVTGEDEEKFIGSDINIYALGFAMLQDIKRICFEPTEEDRDWFPHFAGQENWIEMMHQLMEGYSNETAVEQFLSPKVMRQFKYFLLEGKIKDKFLEVSAIHNREGFEMIRDQLAADYRTSDKIPRIVLRDYQQESDRCLVLQHDIVNDQPLDKKQVNAVLELIHAQTKQPVILESIDCEGNVQASYSSPPNYDHKPHARQEVHFSMQS